MVSRGSSGVQGNSGRILSGNNLQLHSSGPDPYEEALNACLLSLAGQRHFIEGQGFAEDISAS